ncbi:MAG: flagellar protein FlbB [Pseudomonadota bacterium]
MKPVSSPQKPSTLRLLPLLILVASIALTVRIGEVVFQVRAMPGMAFAADPAAPTDAKAAPVKDEKTTDALPVKTDAAPAKAGDPPPVPAAPQVDVPPVAGPAKPKEGQWHDAAEADIDYSAVPEEVFKDLTKRRTALDKRDADMRKREALLKAAEAELKRKYDELSKLRTDIENLLTKQSKEEEDRLASLVKIYEGMKPKDAARIFNTLDMDVLIEVMGRMSERKTSPILAAMEEEKAQNVTIMLAEQKKLPTLPEDQPTLAPSNVAQ